MARYKIKNFIISYIILSILVLSSANSLAQLRFDYPIEKLEPVKIIATYTIKYQQDSLNPNFIKQEDMLLFLGQQKSLFVSSGSYSYDTVMRRLSSTHEYQNFILSSQRQNYRTSFRFWIFKNYPYGKITCHDHVIGGMFKYIEDIDLFNWQLTNDTATIQGYKSQKATCNFGGRSWIAWFSPEIPYSDGPYKFNGLPGLILKVADTKNHYVFVLESIGRPPKELMIDYRVKDFMETTKYGFFSAEDSFREDIIDRAKAAGIGYEDQQRAAQNMAMRNNPIELNRK